jgi:hypothetical protein
MRKNLFMNDTVQPFYYLNIVKPVLKTLVCIKSSRTDLGNDIPYIAAHKAYTLREKELMFNFLDEILRFLSN